MTENLNRWWNKYYKYYQDQSEDSKSALDMYLIVGLTILLIFLVF